MRMVLILFITLFSTLSFAEDTITFDHALVVSDQASLDTTRFRANSFNYVYLTSSATGLVARANCIYGKWGYQFGLTDDKYLEFYVSNTPGSYDRLKAYGYTEDLESTAKCRAKLDELGKVSPEKPLAVERSKLQNAYR